MHYSFGFWHIYLQISKVFSEILTPSTANEYTIIDSFHFAEEICQQDPNFHAAILDLIPYLKKFPQTKLSIFGLKLSTTCAIIRLTCNNLHNNPPNIPGMILVMRLTKLRKNHFLHLATNIINK